MNWKIEKDEQGFHITDDANFSDIAVVYEEKDAKLLCAAPELLEALQDAEKILQQLHEQGYNVQIELRQAKVTIKKALGE